MFSRPEAPSNPSCPVALYPGKLLRGTIKKRVRRLVKSMDWEVQPSCIWCRHSFVTNLTHAGVPHNYISESMGHSVDTNEELKGLTPEQLKALIAMVKNS